jgi:hypothetical protein
MADEIGLHSNHNETSHSKYCQHHLSFWNFLESADLLTFNSFSCGFQKVDRDPLGNGQAIF